MKPILSIKNRLSFFLIFILSVLEGQSSFSQPTFTPKTPYPIIFIHGLCGDGSGWTKPGPMNDVIDYLEGAGLASGGVINITLDHDRDSTSLGNVESSSSWIR